MNSMSVVGCVVAALIVPMAIGSTISQLKQEGLLRRTNGPGADAAMAQRQRAAGSLAQRPCPADDSLPIGPHAAPYALSGSEDRGSAAVPIGPPRSVPAARDGDRPGEEAQDGRAR